MEVALQFSESCSAEVALQHSFFCSAEVAAPETGSAEPGLTKMSVILFFVKWQTTVRKSVPLGNAVCICRKCVQFLCLRLHKANLLLGQNISFIEFFM